jgi:copper chaperone CopZ
LVTKVVNIEGMSCGHCVMAVRKELSRIPEIFVEEVEKGKAVVKFDQEKIKDEEVIRAVENAGYHVISIN